MVTILLHMHQADRALYALSAVPVWCRVCRLWWNTKVKLSRHLHVITLALVWQASLILQVSIPYWLLRLLVQHCSHSAAVMVVFIRLFPSTSHLGFSQPVHAQPVQRYLCCMYSHDARTLCSMLPPMRSFAPQDVGAILKWMAPMPS